MKKASTPDQLDGVPRELGGTRRAWMVWLAALTAYQLGVFHRSALAVAGLHATERFGATAAQLSSFVVLQLLVYVVLQIPIGVLVDRFGPRRILVVGTLLMTGGQVVFALAESYPQAVVARVFVGAGDATTFICVLRLINAWFGPRQIPMLTQITGPAGQVGAIAATFPMTWALSHWGWERSYGTTAAFGVFVTLAVLVVGDAPGRMRVVGERLSWRGVGTTLKISWAEPWTKLGFWTHFTHHFSATALGLVWGFPFLVRSEGVSESTAGFVLTLMIVAIVAAGPLIGWVTSRAPMARVPLVLWSVVLVAVTWTAVLLWPGHAPLPLLCGLAVVVGMTGPVAMVGFDFVRERTPPVRLAGAIGLVNQGGFIASLIAVLAVGVVLDLSTERLGWDEPSRAFALAFSVQFVLWAVGFTQVLRWRHSVDRLRPTGVKRSRVRE